MENDIKQMWDVIKFVAWIGAGAFGLCITGFFYILNSKDGFEKKIDAKVNEAVRILTEIKDALIGTMEKKGVITRVYEAEKELAEVKEKLSEH